MPPSAAPRRRRWQSGVIVCSTISAASAFYYFSFGGDGEAEAPGVGVIDTSAAGACSQS